MRKNEIFPYYRKTSEYLNKVYEYIKTQYDTDYVTELAGLRGYVSSQQKDLIREMQLGCCNILGDFLGEMAKEAGLLTKNDDFLLNDRYIIPIEDINGNISAFVGYYPDYKKYITTPSPFFSKEVQFFNFKQAYELSMKEYDGLVFVVEGIFDTLSMRSIGLPCIGCMGATLSKDKGELLKLFKRVIAIPDDDTTGKKSLDRYSKYGWKVPSNTTLVNLHGGTIDLDGGKLHVKDMDNFVSWYDMEDVREILLSLASSNEEIEDLYI